MAVSSYNSSCSREALAGMVNILVKQNKGLSVSHINAQSLKNKIDEFRLIFENSSVDCICISETWLTESIPDSLISLNRYKVFRADRKKHGGGVAIYIRDGLNCKVIAKSNEDDKVEFLFVEITGNDDNLLLGCAYRPHRSIPFDSFIMKIDVITATYSNVIIAGDFNSNLLVDSSLRDSMMCSGFSAVNSIMPTHYTETCNTLLDLFFVTDTSKILLFDQLSAPCFSKHDLIFMTYNYNAKHFDETLSYRDFRNLNHFELEVNLNNLCWSDMYDMPSVDDQAIFLESNIIKLYDIAVPIRTRIFTAKSRPWFNGHIKHLIQQRDYAHQRWKRFKSESLHLEFKAARKAVNSAIRLAKIKYYANKFSTAITSRSTWSNIREIGIGRKDNTLDVDIDVNELNKSFIHTPNSAGNLNSLYDTNTTVDSQFGFEFACVSLDIVYSCFSSVRSNAIGCDGICPRFLRIILPYILPYVTYLFNTIIMSSTFPSKWKHAKIVPIRKSKTEFRPIAILPFLSKVFEKVIYMQMVSYLNESALLVDNQSGFRAKHSCITALVDVVEDLRSALDDRNVSILVLLDHSKAFDTIDHSILTFKLRNFFHFSASSARLIQSYIGSRSQSVYTKESISVPLQLFRGVPQGSILGPLLFSMYINDLPLHIINCKTHMYADDVQLYLSSSVQHLAEAVDKVNADLQSVYNWASANALSLNPIKSKCLLIRGKSSNCDFNLDLNINKHKINNVSSVKNLGLIFNNTLTWNNHINSVVGNINNKLRALWVTQYFTPLKIRILLAKAYLMPTLLYGCEIFSSCDAISKRKLNTAFNNICRYVYGIGKYDHISQYSVKLFGMSLTCLFRQKMLLLLHKIIYTKLPPYLFRRIVFARSVRGNKVIPLRYRTYTSEMQFLINVLPLWNTLPHSIQTTSNVVHFKALLTKHFFSQNN